jgi:inosine/xanthosine triphosphate pyrophosphatase family protein
MAQPFDLVAEGGADNVWIVEVGTDDDSTFDEFVAAVTGTAPAVERTGTGFDVAWTSPTSGEVTFGWDAPFVVGGAEQQIAEFPRHDSPWGEVERLDTTHRFESAASRLQLDFATFDRQIT